ncbi:MAG: hypothetical protein LBK23_03795 [Oscillospiraceae bacterium]|jgi:hypothetical protein|nr:hypothetical protein [Oscillospiraceae bacterium]
MEYFLQQYFASVKKIVEPLGFKRDKWLFGRVINDVFQCFHIDRIIRSKNYADCRIQFGIEPLCRKIDHKTLQYFLILELGQPLGRQQLDWWDYDRSSEISMDNCVSTVAEDIRTRLVPLFEQAIDTKSALKALCALEKNICETVFAHSDSDVDLYWSSDKDKLYMALKHSNYGYILHAYETIRTQPKREFENFKNKIANSYGYSSFDPQKFNMPSEVVNSINIQTAEIEQSSMERVSIYRIFVEMINARSNKKTIAQLNQQLDDLSIKNNKATKYIDHFISLICERDDEQIRKQLEENEAYSREQLKRFIVKKASR